MIAVYSVIKKTTITYTKATCLSIKNELKSNSPNSTIIANLNDKILDGNARSNKDSPYMYFFSIFDTSAIKETHISVKVIWALNNPDLLMYSVENAVLNPTAPELDTKIILANHRIAKKDVIRILVLRTKDIMRIARLKPTLCLNIK